MKLLVNNLIRQLGWLTVWIFIPIVFMFAQTNTSESNSARSRRNLQTIKSQNLRIDRLEDKAEHITEVMTSIKYLDEKIDNVAGTQKLVLLGVLGALALNALNMFTKRQHDLLSMLSKKQDKS